MLKLEGLRTQLLIIGFILTWVANVVIISDDVQLYILITSILVTGVPHGSLDFFLLKQSLNKEQRRFSKRLFFARYIFIMFSYAVIWYLFPAIALMIFILTAAYHFGEIDWVLHGKSRSNSVIYTIYGFLLIGFLITRHVSSAAPILETIVQNQILTAVWLQWGKHLFPIFSFLLGMNFLVVLILSARMGWENKMIFSFLLQSGALIYIIYALPLYLSFAFYFGLWHSLISFNLIRKNLNLSNDWFGWISIAKKAIPFSIIAWLGIFLLILLSGMLQTEWLILSNLFIGIAILTLPHLQVFTKIKIS